MKAIIIAATLAIAILAAAPILLPEVTTAGYAQGSEAIRKKCRRMLRQKLGLAEGQRYSNKAGGGAGNRSAAIEACVASGGTRI